MNELSRVRALKEKIRKAFPLAPRPAPDSIASRDVNELWRKEVTDALAHRYWNELDRDGLPGSASFALLTAPAFRYYLPGLLTAALDHLHANGGDQGVVWNAVLALQPGSWDVYWYGSDPELDERIAVLTPAQYECVASILSLAMTSGSRIAVAASAAVRWGWNRRPADVDAAMAVKNAMCSFEYPSAPDERTAELIGRIREAFGPCPYPEEPLCEIDREVRNAEAGEYCLEFRRLNWYGLHPTFLGYHGAALSFFTPAAFRYFLPAWLLTDLLRLPEDDTDPVFHLTYGLYDDSEAGRDDRALADDVTDRERQVERCSVFEPQERSVIVDYLTYQLETCSFSFEASQIAQALEYWRSS